MIELVAISQYHPRMATERQIAIYEKNVEKAQRVIDALYETVHVGDALDLVGLTSQTFYELLKTEPKLAAAHAAARQAQAFAMVDDMRKLADSDGDPAKIRNQIDVRKWTASRLNRKDFGDSVDINVTQTVDIGSALSEARQRVTRPVSDQIAHDKAETVDFTELPARSTTDK